jgi:energy-coupling factor transporter ATP-binding protein EcfA2
MKKIVSEEMGKIGIDLDPENAVSTLSGGEKQCLSIVSVIYHRAELLLLDEPTSALEKKQKLNLIKFLKDAQKTHPISIIIVTHSFEEAYYMGDRIIVLRGADLLPIEKQQLIQRERLISKDFYV